jgi:hypothetical protein
MDVKPAEVVLCEFYFSDLKQNKLRRKQSDTHFVSHNPVTTTDETAPLPQGAGAIF